MTPLKLIIASIAATLFIALSACEDPPTGSAPFQQREFIAPDSILGEWVGDIKWSHLDSTDEFEVEFFVDSLIQPDPKDTTQQILVPFFVTRTTYFDVDESEWQIVTGQWTLYDEQYELRWLPNDNNPNILYVGYLSADSLYGFVTASGGREGKWSLHRKQILEQTP